MPRYTRLNTPSVTESGPEEDPSVDTAAEGTPDGHEEDEHLALRQPDVLAQLKRALYPQPLSDKMDQLQTTIENLAS